MFSRSRAVLIGRLHMMQLMIHSRFRIDSSMFGNCPAHVHFRGAYHAGKQQ